MPGIFIIFIMYLYVLIHGYMHISAGAHRGQKRVLDPQELEL